MVTVSCTDIIMVAVFCTAVPAVFSFRRAVRVDRNFYLKAIYPLLNMTS